MRVLPTWQTIIGILIIIVGVVSLLNNLGLIAVTGGQVVGIIFALAVIALGVWLILRSRVPQPVPRHIENFLGDTVIGRHPWELRELNTQIVIGDTKIDLTRATIPDRDATIDASGWIGDTIVLAPSGLGVTVHATVWIGSITVLGRHDEGFSRNLNYTSSNFEVADKRVVMHLNRGIGDILVTRVE